jgi:hypothetical protein
MATSEDGGPVSTDAAEADAKSSDDGEDKGADEQDQASEGGEEE